MKKIISFFLILILILSLSSCNLISNNPDYNNLKPNIFKEKISGQITIGTKFSEGLAFVSIEGDNNTTYCIDKNGYVVFKIDNYSLPKPNPLFFQGIDSSGFINGYTIINKGVCDTKGNITYPSDVGVTSFLSSAFSDRYIIAEKITSDYQSSTYEMGIMNMKFQWVVEPSEEYYRNGKDGIYYSNGFITLTQNKYFNTKTGKIVNTIPTQQPSVPSIDITKYENAVEATKFYNNKAAIIFYNDSVRKFYFTLADTSGTFLFEPKEVENFTATTNTFVAPWYDVDLEFDGEYIIVSKYAIRHGMKDHVLKIYNIKGEFIGEINTSTLRAGEYFCSIDDGVISLYGTTSAISSNSKSWCYYYKPDGTLLFE